MRISEIMTEGAEIISPDMSLKDAAVIMRDADVGFLPIGENDRLVGTVTDRDIVIRCIAEGREPLGTPVREAMTDEIIYCYEDEDTEVAAKLMAQKQVRRLPILNRDKRLVGILSLGDIAGRAGELERTGQTMQDIVE